MDSVLYNAVYRFFVVSNTYVELYLLFFIISNIYVLIRKAIIILLWYSNMVASSDYAFLFFSDLLDVQR